jgi:hypothetical protein
MSEQITITEKVRIGLDELIADYKACWSWQHESFYSFLSEKVAEKLDRELDNFQVMCYSVVGHEHDAVIFEVERYEE